MMYLSAKETETQSSHRGSRQLLNKMTQFKSTVVTYKIWGSMVNRSNGNVRTWVVSKGKFIAQTNESATYYILHSQKKCCPSYSQTGCLSVSLNCLSFTIWLFRRMNSNNPKGLVNIINYDWLIPSMPLVGLSNLLSTTVSPVHRIFKES